MPALDGVRVIDLSQMIAGPYCTQLLADLGADVIKVEEPIAALRTRITLGPPAPEDRRFAAYWVASNRNKRSVTLDLKQPEAKVVLADLVRSSDVVVENYGQHTRQQLGVTDEWGLALNPKLVWASLTGYGRSGPDAGRDGWDFTAQARGGLLSLTGEPDGQPMKTGNSAADYLAGLHLAVAVLGALMQRAHTGRGQTVDISLLEPVMACLDGFPLWYSMAGVLPERSGNFHPAKIPGYSVFACADGHVVLGAVGPSYARLLELIGRPELIETFGTGDADVRQQHFDEAVAAISQWTAARTRAEVRAELDAQRIPSEPVQDVGELWEDEQLRSRGMVVQYDYPPFGAVDAIGSPLHLSDSPVEVRRVPPRAGEHNEEVLRDVLDYDDDQIALLIADGALWGSA